MDSVPDAGITTKELMALFKNRIAVGDEKDKFISLVKQVLFKGRDGMLRRRDRLAAASPTESPRTGTPAPGGA
jgi:hypothetical protein